MVPEPRACRSCQAPRTTTSSASKCSREWRRESSLVRPWWKLRLSASSQPPSRSGCSVGRKVTKLRPGWAGWLTLANLVVTPRRTRPVYWLHAEGSCRGGRCGRAGGPGLEPAPRDLRGHGGHARGDQADGG